MIDEAKIITKEQRDASQAEIARKNAIAKRSARYREQTDPLLFELIRKRFADDPDFAEVTRIAEEIHQEIPIPES